MRLVFTANDRILLFIAATFWLFIPENALTDLILSSSVKLAVVVILILLLFISHLLSWRRWVCGHHFLYVVSLCCMIISLIVRVFYVEDESAGSIAKTAFKYVSVVVLLVATERLFRFLFSVDVVKPLKIPFIVKFCLVSTIASFFVYIVSPHIFFEFQDNQGHELRVVYLTLTSSIYNIGPVSFSRVNFIFDEPGTFGMFIAFAISALVYMLKKFDKRVVLFVSSGVVSLSLSYYLFLIVVMIYWFSRSIVFRLNAWNILWGGVIIVVLVSMYSKRDDVVMLGYVFDRFESVAMNKHNRSDGNFEAVKSIFSYPEGVSVKSFNDRKFSSSGLLVVAAYHGVIYAFSFSLLYAAFFCTLWEIKKIKRGTSLLPLAVVVVITGLSRNNLFNFSGPAILLFAVYVCYLTGFKNSDTR